MGASDIARASARSGLRPGRALMSTFGAMMIFPAPVSVYVVASSSSPGYELVEGRRRGDRIVELRRVDFARAAVSRAVGY